MKTIKDIFKVAVSNCLNFGSSLIVGFILPTFLAVSDYGYFRQFNFYLSFVFILNLGFNDGIYIKYGGKKIDCMDKSSLISEHKFIFVYHLLLGLSLAAVCLKLNNIFLSYICIVSFFYLVIGYHQNLLQAIGEFNAFSLLSAFRTVIYLVMLLLCLILPGNKNYFRYILSLGISYVLQFLGYEFLFYKRIGVRSISSINWGSCISLFSVGFFILVGNMASSFIGSVGNWSINIFMPIEDFARYNFQNSILNIFLLVINSIGLVFYNVIINKESTRFLIWVKNMCFIIGAVCCLGYFPLSWIVLNYIDKYASTLSVLKAILISLPILITINILTNNLYKAKKMQKQYFNDSIAIALFASIVVFAVTYVSKSLLYTAYATTVVYFAWYLFLSVYRFDFLAINGKELLKWISFLFFFYISTLCNNIFVFFTLYLMFCLIFIRVNWRSIMNVKVFLDD